MKNFCAFLLIIASNFSFAQSILDDIKNGNIKAVQIWLQGNSDKNKKYLRRTEDGLDSIMVHVVEWAGYCNNTEILDLLIQHKEKFSNYQDLLAQALAANIHHCDVKTVNKLLDAGAPLNGLCSLCHDAPPLAISLAHNCYPIYRLLLSRGAPLINESAGYDVIHAAATCDSIAVLKDLIEKKGLEPTALDNQFQVTAIHYAVMEQKYEQLKYLINKGYSINHEDVGGKTILHYATNLQTFGLLDSNYNTPSFLATEENSNLPLLYHVISNDDKALFDYFINQYPGVTKMRYENASPLLHQLLNTKINTAYFFEQLMAYIDEAEIKRKDKEGFTLIDYAKSEHRPDIIELIKKYKPVKSASAAPSFIDTVKIGTQVWMKNNLHTNKFNNGDIILRVKTQEEWETADANKKPLFMITKNGEYLYNWYAVADKRGIAPVGWHIPDSAAWNKLIKHAGGYHKAGLHLKSKKMWFCKHDGNTEYECYGGNGSNLSGFDGQPQGRCTDFTNVSNEEISFGELGGWWTSSEFNENEACVVYFGYNSNEASRVHDLKSVGWSVRLIRD